jgi:hypothetical protein
MNLFRTIEEHIFTLAFGAFHNYSVIGFAVNADPYSAGIASPAEQQPSEPGESSAMHVRNLRDRVLFPFGRISRKGKCILFTGQTLFAPLLKASIRLMAPNRGKVKKKLPHGPSRTTFPLIGFRPERVLFRPGCVNLRASLCGVPLPPKGGKRNDQIMYASAQALDFLARTKNPSFPNRNLAGRGICPGVSGWTLIGPETLYTDVGELILVDAPPAAGPLRLKDAVQRGPTPAMRQRAAL